MCKNLYIKSIINYYAMKRRMVFLIDEEVVEEARKKAEKEGVSLSALMRLLMKSYIDDEISISVVPTGGKSILEKIADKIGGIVEEASEIVEGD